MIFRRRPRPTRFDVMGNPDERANDDVNMYERRPSRPGMILWRKDIARFYFCTSACLLRLPIHFGGFRSSLMGMVGKNLDVFSWRAAWKILFDSYDSPISRVLNHPEAQYVNASLLARLDKSGRPASVVTMKDVHRAKAGTFFFSESKGLFVVCHDKLILFVGQDGENPYLLKFSGLEDTFVGTIRLVESVMLHIIR